jgi:hypothetical protein
MSGAQQLARGADSAHRRRQAGEAVAGRRGRGATDRAAARPRRAPELFMNLPIIRNMEKLEHFEAISMVELAPERMKLPSPPSRSSRSRPRSRRTPGGRPVEPAHPGRAGAGVAELSTLPASSPRSSREARSDATERFRSLPPEEQQRLRDTYQRYRGLPREQRREFTEKYRRWRERQ